MLTWIALAGGIAVVLIASRILFLRVRRRLVTRAETLTPYTEQHGRELEKRLHELVDTSHRQTSSLQESLEALRAGRRRHEGK
jgi:hypothetical protein